MNDHSLFVCSVGLLGSIYCSLAQANAQCETPLTTQSFDKTDRMESGRVIMSQRDHLCSRDFSSQEEAYQAAKGAKMNAGFKAFSAGGSKGASESSKKYRIRDSQFCQSNTQDFLSEIESSMQQTTTSIALDVWKDCIKTTADVNNIYTEWEFDGDRSISGFIHVRHRKGSWPKINGVKVAPLDFPESAIICDIGLKKTIVDLNAAGGAQITGSDMPFVCSVIEGQEFGEVRILFDTGHEGESMVIKSLEQRKVDAIDAIVKRLDTNDLRLQEHSRDLYDLRVNHGQLRVRADSLAKELENEQKEIRNDHSNLKDTFYKFLDKNPSLKR